MHIVRKNSTLVTAYVFQSLVLVVLLGIEVYQEASLGLLLVTLVMFVIKVIFAPVLFRRLINRSHQNLSATAYLNIPMTLIVLLILFVFSQSEILSQVSSLFPATLPLKGVLMGSLLMSIFLIINRKGALSQIIGILSLENSIFTFGILLGVRQQSALELGMLFDVFFWIMISSIFVSMIFKNFGSFDISKLNQLKK